MAEKQLKEFTRKEVEEFKSEEKGYYMIIHNKVYDVTKFVTEHPGGEEVLIEQAGKESTSEFEDVGHSSDAKDLMAQYLIGTIVESEQIEYGKKKPKNTDNSKNLVIIGASIVAIAAGIFIFYKIGRTKQ